MQAARLFNAGTFGSSFNVVGGRIFEKLTPIEQKMRQYNSNFLESYHYLATGQVTSRIRRDGARVFLDSGAYTASTKGTVIDLNRYIEYCHKNADIIEMISVLDEIPKAPKGGQLTLDIVRQAADVTLRNLHEMERQGLTNIIPTFHMGEDEENLRYFVANYPYISLGGLVGAHPKQLMIWLDRVWALYLTNPDGTPKIKVHGFGLTSLPIMTRYPWYSVDSSTWVQWAANGMILMPDRFPGQQNVSNQSSFRKMRDQHLTTYCEVNRNALEDEIRRLGGDPQRLGDLYYVRWAWNYFAFPYYLKLHPNTGHFKPEYIGLFDEAS